MIARLGHCLLLGQYMPYIPSIYPSLFFGLIYDMCGPRSRYSDETRSAKTNKIRADDASQEDLKNQVSNPHLILTILTSSSSPHPHHPHLILIILT